MKSPMILQGVRNRSSQLRQEATRIPDAYLEVARGMERQFVHYMVEQMRKTIKPARPESTPLRFYQSMLIDYQVDIMTQKNKGKGLQKMILKQIYPEYREEVVK